MCVYGQMPSHTVLPRSFQTHLCVGPKPWPLAELPKRPQMPSFDDFAKDLRKVDAPAALDQLTKAIERIDIPKALERIELPDAIEQRLPGRR